MFNNTDLLQKALTHPSCAQQQDALPYNNQRLEFLGDSVLGLVVAEMLYGMYPNEPEGDLAKRFAGLVCGERLVEIAQTLKLGDELLLSASELEADGRNNASNLEDTLEAVIGALYLDQGLEAAKTFIHQHWRELAESVTEPPRDPKTALQEWVQSKGLSLPLYMVVKEEGLAHAPEFTVEVQVEGYAPTQGIAGSKKLAERQAAAAMLVNLEVS